MSRLKQKKRSDRPVVIMGGVLAYLITALSISGQVMASDDPNGLKDLDDYLRYAALHNAGLRARFGPVRGQGHALRLLEWLGGLQAEGMTDLSAVLRTYAVASGRPGLAVLISDLFSPAGYVEGLTALAARGHEVAIIHVLSPDEVEPPLGGDLRLLDVETGEPQEVTIDGGMRTLYRRRLATWRDEIQATCRARDVHYVPVVTDTPFDRVVTYDLRRAGLVR